MVGGIYRIFGLTLTAGRVSWLVRSAIYATLCGLMPWLAGRFGLGRQAGVLGGTAGALIPGQPGHGEALAALALGLLMVGCLRRWTSGQVSTIGSLLLGAGFGAAFHVQPAILTVMMGCVAFELWLNRRNRRTWARTAAMILGAALACVPWAWRNYVTFHDVFFIRSNFGLELRAGNHEGAHPDLDISSRRGTLLHPRIHPDEARLVRELGEVEYMRRAGREALDWIRANPGTYLWLTARRAVLFWTGPLHHQPAAVPVLALSILAFWGAWHAVPRLTVPRRAALLIPLAAFPLVYYTVGYLARYREPLDWILLLLAGSLLWGWIGPDAGAERRGECRS
jgi:hypothetical protein